jgi:hypothetical protein
MLDVLNNLKIASPCHVAWESMQNLNDEGSVRHCNKCDLNVYNISEMTSAKARALIEKNEGSLCVRMYKRPDGTLITADCPVGVKRKRRRMALLGAGLAASFAFAATAFGILKTNKQCASPNAPQSRIADLEPFKTLAHYIPWLAAQQTPAPQPLMGAIAVPMRVNNNNGTGTGGHTP